jgi:hypothetical protein
MVRPTFGLGRGMLISSNALMARHMLTALGSIWLTIRWVHRRYRLVPSMDNHPKHHQLMQRLLFHWLKKI